MNSTQLRQFFEAYGKSFEKSEVEIAHFYSVPCITARAGSVRLNLTSSDIEAFFGQVLSNYRAKGNTQGEILDMNASALGQNCIAATLRWAYKNGEGKTLWESTFTYNLYRGPGGWKILLQTMHDEA